MTVSHRRYIWQASLTVGLALLAAALLVRADDPAGESASDEAALRRVISLWHGGQRQQAWFLYQDLTRRINADLQLRQPRNAKLALLRQEAADAIGAQFGQESIRQDRRTRRVGADDYPQWGGWAGRNNVALADEGPADWAPGDFDRKTGIWRKETSRNVKWVAPLGSQTYTTPVVAGGRVYIGTNNSHGNLPRAPADVDLGCLVAFREKDGGLLWQLSSEKLPTGRVHDWPLQGICSTPLVEGDRLWVVTNRCEVRCLDTEGFYDGQDDGLPASAEPARLFDVRVPRTPLLNHLPELEAALDAGRLPEELRPKFAAAGYDLAGGVTIRRADDERLPHRRWTLQAFLGHTPRDFIITSSNLKLSAFVILTPDDRLEADTVWKLDMMQELGVSPHNMTVCSPTALGDVLFICTANGVDESHLNLPAPHAPSFLALDKRTGKILWTDSSPGANVHHANWGSPAVGVFAGVPQVIFGGGDGWVYGFHATQWQGSRPQLLWKFDTNPKDAVLELGGRGTRNEPIAFPVVYDGLVYVTIGQDPEHGEGLGGLWCLDPTRRGDISPQLAIRRDDRSIVPHRRVQAVDPKLGEIAIDNPNSAVIWHYGNRDRNGDGKFDFEESLHRALASVVVKDDLLFAVDFSGLAHCLHAKTGRVFWTCDLLAAAWCTPLVAGDRIYVPDEDGDIALLRLHPDPRRSMDWVPSKDGPFFGSYQPQDEINMGTSVYSTPIIANGVLYIAAKDRLFAIAAP
jgi:outer membrane protein assembly factor BamB